MPDKDVAERLTAARLAAGYKTRREATKDLGWNHDTYVSHEGARRGIKRSVIMEYARAYNVPPNWLLTGQGASNSTIVQLRSPDIVSPQMISLPVLGSVQGGAFMEAVPIPENDLEQMPVAQDSRYEGYDQYLLRVHGPSMNIDFPEGSYAHCVRIDFHPDERLPDSGTNVIVERRKAGLVEVTIKEFVLSEDGKAELWPRSHDPAWTTPIIMNGNADFEEIKIVGIAIGIYRRL